MTDTQPIAWKRLTIEATAIVVSILLAFSIDAWWSNLQEREAEDIALRSLRDDFESSRIELADRIQTVQGSRIHFQTFQSASLEDLGTLQQSVAEQMLASLHTGGTFDAYLGTLDAIAADGRLALIRDSGIRRLLSKWTKAMKDIEEDNMAVRSGSIRVRAKMEPYGGPFFTGFVGESGPPASDIFPRANGSIVAKLRSDASFVSAVRSHQFSISIYLMELEKASKIIEELIRLLEQNTEIP
jgi:hypothetical protein